MIVYFDTSAFVKRYVSEANASVTATGKTPHYYLLNTRQQILDISLR